MQCSFAVETRALALRLVIEMILDAGLKPCIWALRWCWNAGVESYF